METSLSKTVFSWKYCPSMKHVKTCYWLFFLRGKFIECGTRERSKRGKIDFMSRVSTGYLVQLTAPGITKLALVRGKKSLSGWLNDRYEKYVCLSSQDGRVVQWTVLWSVWLPRCEVKSNTGWNQISVHLTINQVKIRVRKRGVK
jgi:hypothetical protein